MSHAANPMDPEQVARVRDVFDDWALRGRAEGMEAGHGAAVRVGLDWLALQPGERFLDIGCGNGYAVRWAAAQAGPTGLAAGIDVAPAMVARARELSVDVPATEFQVATWPASPYPPAHFDAVLSMEVFYYLPDLQASLAAVRESLVPGGRFALLMDHYEENVASHAWPQQLGVGMHRLTRGAWWRALEEAGFEVEAQEQVRQPRGAEDEAAWKVQVGTLLLVARRPSLGGAEPAI